MTSILISFSYKKTTFVNVVFFVIVTNLTNNIYLLMVVQLKWIILFFKINDLNYLLWLICLFDIKICISNQSDCSLNQEQSKWLFHNIRIQEKLNWMTPGKYKIQAQ